jgi:hypothetical protein
LVAVADDVALFDRIGERRATGGQVTPQRHPRFAGGHELGAPVEIVSRRDGFH